LPPDQSYIPLWQYRYARRGLTVALAFGSALVAVALSATLAVRLLFGTLSLFFYVVAPLALLCGGIVISYALRVGKIPGPHHLSISRQEVTLCFQSTFGERTRRVATPWTEVRIGPGSSGRTQSFILELGYDPLRRERIKLPITPEIKSVISAFALQG
jgi:hypothetical protein